MLIDDRKADTERRLQTLIRNQGILKQEINIAMITDEDKKSLYVELLKMIDKAIILEKKQLKNIN